VFRATRETSIRKKHSKKNKAQTAREHNKRHVEARNGLREEEKSSFTSIERLLALERAVVESVMVLPRLVVLT
jgi:hypothetical protein